MILGIMPDVERPGGQEGLLWALGQRTVVGEGTGSGVHRQGSDSRLAQLPTSSEIQAS